MGILSNGSFWIYDAEDLRSANAWPEDYQKQYDLVFDEYGLDLVFVDDGIYQIDMPVGANVSAILISGGSGGSILSGTGAPGDHWSQLNSSHPDPVAGGFTANSRVNHPMLTGYDSGGDSGSLAVINDCYVPQGYRIIIVVGSGGRGQQQNELAGGGSGADRYSIYKGEAGGYSAMIVSSGVRNSSIPGTTPFYHGNISYSYIASGRRPEYRRQINTYATTGDWSIGRSSIGGSFGPYFEPGDPANTDLPLPPRLGAEKAIIFTTPGTYYPIIYDGSGAVVTSGNVGYGKPAGFDTAGITVKAGQYYELNEAQFTPTSYGNIYRGGGGGPSYHWFVAGGRGTMITNYDDDINEDEYIKVFNGAVYQYPGGDSYISTQQQNRPSVYGTYPGSTLVEIQSGTASEYANALPYISTSIGGFGNVGSAQGTYVWGNDGVNYRYIYDNKTSITEHTINGNTYTSAELTMTYPGSNTMINWSIVSDEKFRGARFSTGAMTFPHHYGGGGGHTGVPGGNGQNGRKGIVRLMIRSQARVQRYQSNISSNLNDFDLRPENTVVEISKPTQNTANVNIVKRSENGSQYVQEILDEYLIPFVQNANIKIALGATQYGANSQYRFANVAGPPQSPYWYYWKAGNANTAPSFHHPSWLPYP